MKKRHLIYLLFLFLIGCILYAFFIEPNKIVMRHYTIGQSNSKDVIKIVQLSDIHIQKNYSINQLEKIVEKVNAEKPDIIVFTGDLFDNYALYGPSEEVSRSLQKLSAPLGKYAI